MTDKRKLSDPIPQGERESVPYQVPMTRWGITAPVVVDITVRRYVDGDPIDDVTSTVITGSSSVVGDTIYLAPIANLTAGERYRVDVVFTGGGAQLDGWFDIIGEI